VLTLISLLTLSANLAYVELYKHLHASRPVLVFHFFIWYLLLTGSNITTESYSCT